MLKNPVIITITRDNEFEPEQREIGREIEEAKSEHRESVTRRVPTQAQQRSDAQRRLAMSMEAVEEGKFESAYE